MKLQKFARLFDYKDGQILYTISENDNGDPAIEMSVYINDMRVAVTLSGMSKDVNEILATTTQENANYAADQLLEAFEGSFAQAS